MKLVSFNRDGRPSWGVLEDRTVHETASERCPSLRSAIACGAINEDLVSAATARFELADIELAPLIPDAGKIICVGLNYNEHREESHNPVLEYPTLFIRWPDSLLGHGAAIVHPCVTTKLDYEGEMAVIIGREAHGVKAEDAYDFVAGYACFNDVSVRDWQKHTSQMTAGKNFPATGPFGPYMLTADEVPDARDLELTTRLNGKVLQQASTRDMIFDIPRLIEYITTFTTLAPGDVLVTGTPGGVGFRRDPQVFMVPGDIVEVEITGLGTLSNEITLS